MAFISDIILLMVEDRLLFFKAYIRPHFDYCSVIWDTSAFPNISKITKLQRRACKACKLILRTDYSNLEETRDRLKNARLFWECIFTESQSNV